MLSVYPPLSYVWQNVSFISDQTAGFNDNTSSISGKFSAVIFQTKDLSPITSSPRVGANLNPNLQLRVDSTGNTGSLTTQVWGGASPTNDANFGDISHLSGYPGTLRDIAYTLTFARNGFSTPSNLRINLSVSSNWIKGSSDISAGRGHTFLIADGHNPDGDFVGLLLPVPLQKMIPQITLNIFMLMYLRSIPI